MVNSTQAYITNEDHVAIANGRSGDRPVRVLYSFPHKIGASRICHTAWQQVNGLAAAGADVLAFPGAVHRALPGSVRTHPTLARGKFRIPYRLLGLMSACALHDRIVARRLERLAGQIDIVHVWPLGALKTLQTAARLGIPTVLERANAHTRFAYTVVQQECERLGVSLPPGHEHAFNAAILHKEEEEYRLADRLLCPSDFVVQTFLEQGFKKEQLIRHTYGFDQRVFFPAPRPQKASRGLTALFVGVCAVRKGLHHALEAWLRSPAHRDGSFLIAGEFLPLYRERLSSLLAHPSVHVLGHRNDVPDLMRKSDILILPTIEEGSPLVCAEAMGSGCVPVVSDVCIGTCKHLTNALIHRAGDVETLTEHITMLWQDRSLLERLRSAALNGLPDITWTAAGVRLLEVYKTVLSAKKCA
jgi:glycosyltransferase involved in cell wall biosynthesis